MPRSGEIRSRTGLQPYVMDSRIEMRNIGSAAVYNDTLSQQNWRCRLGLYQAHGKDTSDEFVQLIEAVEKADLKAAGLEDTTLQYENKCRLLAAFHWNQRG